MSEDRDSSTDRQTEPAEFVAIIEPLERHAQPPRRARGLGRAKLLRAFNECPAGFSRLAEHALHHADRNPIGMLIYLVAAGDHRVPIAAATCTHRQCRGRATCRFADLAKYNRADEPRTYSPPPPVPAKPVCVDDCMVCGERVPLFDVDGRLVCNGCAGKAAA